MLEGPLLLLLLLLAMQWRCRSNTDRLAVDMQLSRRGRSAVSAVQFGHSGRWSRNKIVQFGLVVRLSWRCARRLIHCWAAAPRRAAPGDLTERDAAAAAAAVRWRRCSRIAFVAWRHQLLLGRRLSHQRHQKLYIWLCWILSLHISADVLSRCTWFGLASSRVSAAAP